MNAELPAQAHLPAKPAQRLLKLWELTRNVWASRDESNAARSLEKEGYPAHSEAYFDFAFPSSLAMPL